MKKFEIQGIEYVMAQPTFGDDLDAMDGAVEVIMSKDGGQATPKFNSSIISLHSILACLKSWTFRGYDKEKETLITDGPILKIDADTLRTLPSSHSNLLLKVAKSLSEAKPNELKNFPELS